jgi:predicted HTH transcriptional regulator
MTPLELSRLVSLGEGSHLEFKLRVPRPQRIAKEIIAFANTRGGQLLLGVDDDGTIAGLRDVGEEEFALRDALSQYCEPPVQVEVERIPIAHRRDVIIVRVAESEAKPHFLIDPEAEDPGTAYIRVDDKSVEASKEALDLLMADGEERVVFEFGEKERLLLRYLDQYGRITVSEYATVANLPDELASATLVLLTKAGILDLHAGHHVDYYTIAYDTGD